MKHFSAVNQNNAQYWSVSAGTIIPLNCPWSDLKFYKKDKSKNQDTSVLNSHHCHYPRLWNNVYQISCRSSVSVGGHVVPKKALKIPAITNPTSLSSPQCLCLSHSLSLSPSRATFFLRPSISSRLFSLTSPFLCLSIAPFFPSHACSVCTLTFTRKGPQGFGYQSWDKSVCRSGAGQLSSVFSISETGRKSAEKRAWWFAAVHICMYP